MKDFLVRVATYLATNKKARAAEWAVVLAVFEAVRVALGNA